MRLSNLLSLPNLYFGADEAALISLVTTLGQPIAAEVLYGQFSIATQQGDFYYLIRDRLGINKLFYHLDNAAGVLTVANSVHRLSSAVRDYNHIFSVPPGCLVKIHASTGEKEIVNYYDISRVEAIPVEQFDVPKFAAQASATLGKFFQQLNRTFPQSRFVVCLSGGLDSSVVASFARRFLDSPVATSFSYGTAGPNSTSEDFSAASQIAATLGLPFIPIVKDKRLEMEMLDEVLLACQDWRDFNVHCAWLNNLIGQEIRQRYPDDHLVFLTGDLMNEFVADYTPVTYKDVLYYPQPKLSRDRLRRFFIYGLDTSDREVGIFDRWGATTIQPYSVLAESYLRVPQEIIQLPNSKEVLNLSLVADPKIESQIVKTKVRAQVGGSDGGTLGLFHDHGLSQEKLKARWDSLFAAQTRESEVTPLIVSGRYRS